MKHALAAIVMSAALVGCQHTSSTPAEPVAVAPDPAMANWQEATFGPLAALAGKRLRGVSSDENGTVDHQLWEWTLGGYVLRNIHVLEDGSYGGETLVYPDAGTGALTFVYVTIAGFRTEGTMSFGEDGEWIAEEMVLGHPSITLVRSTGRIMPDGTIVTQSGYLDAGEWVEGHGFTYVPTDEPMPDFAPPGAD